MAWLNLVHNRARTAVAVAGVCFAIILMFMQLGFLEAVKASATLIYDVVDFDVCIRSVDYLNLADARTFPRQRLVQARGVEGVASAVPLHTALGTWRHPANGEKRGILIMGVRPEDPVFLDPRTQVATRRLRLPEQVLIDTETRVEFGPSNGRRFGEEDRGRATEINNQRIVVAGHFTRGAGLNASGAVLINQRGFFQVAAGGDTDRISFVLVKTVRGADPGEVAGQLRIALPDDVEVLTRRETLDREMDRWVHETNYGLIFLSGVCVAVIVGTAIVYQVLSSEVSSMLPQYATLRAMGYPDRYLASVVLQEATALALVGFVPGVGVAQILYRVTAAGAGIPVRFTAMNFFSVMGLSLLMCTISALMCIRKSFRADPADLS